MTWQRFRLKHVARINARVLPEDTDVDREIRYVDISSVGHGRLVSDPQLIRFGDAPSRARRLVAYGDTIISTVRTYLRAVLPVTEGASDAVVSTGFAVVSPRAPLDPRFLGWWAQSDACVERIVARSVGVSYPAVTAGEIGELEIRVPPPHLQKAIAAFLDAETTRIDQLIERYQRVSTLAAERFDARSDFAISPEGVPLERLRHVSGGVTVGVVVNPSAYVDEAGEIPFFRGVDVTPFSLDLARSQRISGESSRVLAKTKLRDGDIVSVRVGMPGISAVVPPSADGANCASLLITRRSDRVDSSYLCHVFNSAFGRRQFHTFANGAAQLQVNVSDAVDFRVPMRSLDEQRRMATELNAAWTQVRVLQEATDRQVRSLLERRQALITAAVTGQLDVAAATV